MWRGFVIAGLTAVGLLTSAAALPAQRDSTSRVALVIGNSAYQNAPQLRNPANDADAVARALRATGFQVIEVKDASKQRLERAIGEFGTRLRKGGVGLFFYSGHGMQVNGKNFLIPVDARLASEGTARIETTDIDLVLDQMALAETGFNMLILDACRNNPFERRFRSLSRGLAAVDDAPRGTLIAYSTAPGKVALDGEGANGVYTAELLKAIRTPGLTAEQVFKRVRIAVAADTGDAQTPWEESSLTGEFYFMPGKPGMAMPTPEPAVDVAPRVAVMTPPLAVAPDLSRSAANICPARGTELRDSTGISMRYERVDGSACCGSAMVNNRPLEVCIYAGVVLHIPSNGFVEDYYAGAKDEVMKLWPLKVGNTVSYVWAEPSIGGGTFAQVSEEYRVTGFQSVTVPAGTFQVFVITHQQKLLSTTRGAANSKQDYIEHFYIDPSLGVPVKYEYLPMLAEAASTERKSWEAVSITRP